MAAVAIRLVRFPGASDEECRTFAQCLAGQMAEGPARDHDKDREREVSDLDRLEFVLYDVPDADAAMEAVAKAAATCDADWGRLYKFG